MLFRPLYREDAEGIDFWVKVPRDDRLFPVQVTQLGVRLFRKHHSPNRRLLHEFIKHRERRVKDKRERSKKHGIAFVLVRDFDGLNTYPKLADSDIKALRYAISHMKLFS